MAKSNRPWMYNNKKNKTKPVAAATEERTECTTCQGSFPDMSMMEFTHHVINCRQQ
ncbi:unnamed protein product, partial [Ilex paraguariensis]